MPNMKAGYFLSGFPVAKFTPCDPPTLDQSVDMVAVDEARSGGLILWHPSDGLYIRQKFWSKGVVRYEWYIADPQETGWETPE